MHMFCDTAKCCQLYWRWWRKLPSSLKTVPSRSTAVRCVNMESNLNFKSNTLLSSVFVIYNLGAERGGYSTSKIGSTFQLPLTNVKVKEPKFYGSLQRVLVPHKHLPRDMRQNKSRKLSRPDIFIICRKDLELTLDLLVNKFSLISVSIQEKILEMWFDKFLDIYVFHGWVKTRIPLFLLQSIQS